MSILTFPDNFIENLNKQKNDELARLLEEKNKMIKLQDDLFNSFVVIINELLQKINLSKHNDTLNINTQFYSKDIIIMLEHPNYKKLLNELKDNYFTIKNNLGPSWYDKKIRIYFVNNTLKTEIKEICIGYY